MNIAGPLIILFILIIKWGNIHVSQCSESLTGLQLPALLYLNLFDQTGTLAVLNFSQTSRRFSFSAFTRKKTCASTFLYYSGKTSTFMWHRACNKKKRKTGKMRSIIGPTRWIDRYSNRLYNAWAVTAIEQNPKRRVGRAARRNS